MKKIALILSCFFLFSAFKAIDHKYYLSSTDIVYKKEKKDLQIITKVFVDDFEELLRTRYDENIRLSLKEENGEVKKAIEDYLSNKLKIKADGKQLDLHYLGKEYDLDQMVMYVEVENLEAFSEISIQNLVLTDLYDDQKNVVNVTVGDEVKNLLLSKDESQGNLKF